MRGHRNRRRAGYRSPVRNHHHAGQFGHQAGPIRHRAAQLWYLHLGQSSPNCLVTLLDQFHFIHPAGRLDQVL
jgi:hypothetical protein